MNEWGTHQQGKSRREKSHAVAVVVPGMGYGGDLIFRFRTESASARMSSKSMRHKVEEIRKLIRMRVYTTSTPPIRSGK
jgi:hypothetical protein